MISLGHPHSGLLHLFLFWLALTLVSISISILICQLFSPYPPLPTPLFVPFLIALRHPLGRFRFDFYDFAPRTLCLICILYSIRIRFQFVFVIHVYLPLPLPLPQLLPLPLPLRSPCGYASCRCCCPAGLLFSLLGRKWQLRQIESVAEQCHSNKADAVGQQAVEDDATNTPAIYLPLPCSHSSAANLISISISN